MSKDLNKVQLIGRLTQDPEVRTTPTGLTVATFSVATNRQWKDAAGATQSQTEYHNIVAWRKLADIIKQYLTKGKQIYVEGYLQTRSWVGTQDNLKRYRTEIIADNIIFLGSPAGSAQGQNAAITAPHEMNNEVPAAPTEVPVTPAQPTVPPAAPAEEEIRIEDIPF
ncbi:MAG: single-stranded DNA-binding protein [bacterium]|nr:single-stranded DNA-binding protein [bacterium]